MTDPIRLTTTPPGVKLCSVDDIDVGGGRNFVLQMRLGRFHGFVIRSQGRVDGYVDRCPHAGLPLAQKLDEYLTPDGSMIACSWHGALFRIEDGLCLGGPCAGQSLTVWPVEIAADWIVTA